MNFSLKLERSMYDHVERVFMAMSNHYPWETISDYKDHVNIQNLLLKIKNKMVRTSHQVNNKPVSIPVDINEYFSLSNYMSYFDKEMDRVPYYYVFVHELNSQVYQKIFQQYTKYKSGQLKYQKSLQQ